MALARQFVTVPDFDYAGTYFPDILVRLRQAGRRYAPEITNEDPRDPFMQAEWAFALMGHYNNVLLDMVANGSYISTSRIPETVKLLFELVGHRLLPAGPGRVDMLATLSARYAAATRLLNPYRKFATRRSPDAPEIVFENPVAFDLSMRTDAEGLGYAYAVHYSGSGSNGVLSSIYPDVVYDEDGPFRDTDVNHYMRIEDSILGNNDDMLRIVEVFDEVGSFSPPHYRKVRLTGSSFVSESDVTWSIYTIGEDLAPSWSAGGDETPFTGMHDNDKLYLGHPDVMWDRLDFTLSGSHVLGYNGVWEFYDPSEGNVAPDSVGVDVGSMTFNLYTLFGSPNCAGTLVEVTYIPTGAKYRGFSYYTDGNYLTVPSYLDQYPTPSEEAGDYTLKAKWRPLPGISDETFLGASSLAVSGKIEFDVPRTLTDSWYKNRIFDHATAEDRLGFFVRYRVIDAGGEDLPTINRIRIDRGEQYAIIRCVQGQTVEDSALGSSSGEANQQFVLSRTPYVLASARIFVNEGGTEYEWTIYSSLLRSGSNDRHCKVDPQTDGTAIVKFGDGTNGKIPPTGSNNIRAMYRIGADRDGNIGAGTLTVNRDGAGVFKDVTNPRAGRYWIGADWSSELSLERAKVRLSREFRAMRRVVHPSDAEILSRTFINRLGVRPVVRSRAYEESFGPKTIEVVVVGGGGAVISSDERAEIEEFFNGGLVYGYNGCCIANTRVQLTNYSPRLIPLNIRIEAYSVITEYLIRQLMSYILSPTAIESNGRSYMWRFGQTVALSRIASEVFKLSPGNVFDVDISSPTVDIGLSSRELPMFDYANSNVVIVPPSFS